MSPAARFEAALSSIPTPGGGGCHAALLRVANYAALAGLDPENAAYAIHGRIPPGGRRVSLREVKQAVVKAYNGREGGQQWTPAPRPRTTRRKPDTGRFWRECGRKYPEAMDPVEALWESSPVRIDWPPEEDAARLLAALYAPEEWLYIGGAQEPGIMGGNIRTVREWLAHFEAGGDSCPHIIPNPLTGQPGPKKDGEGFTLRGDSCVAAWRYVVCEFDHVTHAAQAAFWLAARLPLAVVVDSGGKSLHGWLRVDCPDADTWEREVEQDLFPGLLAPLGADPACKNEARMSRTPGHLRDTGRIQRLLYLNPNAGRAVA